MAILNLTPARIKSDTLLKKSFLTAGILFAVICLIGVATKYIVDTSGAISSVLQGTGRWDADFLRSSAGAFATARIVFIVGAVLVGATSFMSIYWVFRLNSASRQFIIAFYILYALGQGIGFGILFMMFNSIEMISIFGIAGGIFITMGALGFFVKNGTRLLPFMLIGTAAFIVMSIISLILYFTGVYSETLILVMTILSGALTCLYILFDVWFIRTSDDFYGEGNMDKDTEFRAVSFFGFRLASDLIAMVWTIARLYLMRK